MAAMRQKQTSERFKRTLLHEAHRLLNPLIICERSKTHGHASQITKKHICVFCHLYVITHHKHCHLQLEMLGLCTIIHHSISLCTIMHHSIVIQRLLFFPLQMRSTKRVSVWPVGLIAVLWYVIITFY